MSIYIKRVEKSGKIVYWFDGKRSSLSRMSPRVARIVEALPEGASYDDSPEAPVSIIPGGQRCLFCGEHGTRRRFIHLQMVYLCEDDYQNKTIGEVGQYVKELQHAQEKETQKV